MKIKLITGATSYEAAINTIRQIEPFDLETKNLVVVPDSFSMQAESLIFDVLKIKSTLNIEVVGISRLASKILRNQNIPFQRISGLEEIFNIYKAVKECEDKFVYFNKCGVDFCLKILQIIKQFKACKIKPSQIKKVGDDLLDRKMQDLRIIYECYENLLGEKFDLSKLLEFFVENTGKCIDLSKTRLFFVNFDSFSMEINSFICKLAGSVKDVHIGFARPISIGNAFIYEDDILKKTTQYAKEYGINVEVENFETNIKGEQLMMVKNLFSLNVEQGQSDFFVNVIPKNKKDEIEFVAKFIKNSIVNGGHFKDFAVAVADKNYFDEIKTVFSQYEITSYCDDAVDLSQTILGKFLVKILKIAKLGFHKEDLQFLVSSPFVPAENKEDVLNKIEYYNIEDKEEFIERFPEFKIWIEKIENLKNCRKLSDFLSILSEIIEIIQIPYQKILSDLQNESYFKKESENSQAKDLFAKVIEKLKELGGDENFDIFDFEKLFTLAITSVKVETIPSYIDAVYVGDAMDSYFEDVKVLFVLGATAGNLPRSQNDVGIIDDDDIKKLRLEFALEPEIKVLNRRSRLKLFEALQHAKEKLIVSTPMSENDKLSQKAGFVVDLLKMFGNNVIHTASIEDFNLGLLSEDEILDKLSFYVGNVQNLSTAIVKLKTENKLPRKWINTLEKLVDEKILTDEKKFDCQIDRQSFAKQTISATELETYFSCPFRRFVSYDLKIKKKETIEPNKRLFGTFEHELLKVFMETFDMNVADLSQTEIDEFLHHNVEKIAKNVYDEKVLKRKYFLKYLFNESKIILKNVVFEQKNSKFKPILLEEKIYQKIFKNCNLIGFVDRVDRANNYFRIIDYKTGKTDGIKKDLYYGKKLQLFLYAKCIKNKLGLDCAGVYYFDCQTKYTKQNQNVTLLSGLTLKENDVVDLVDGRLWQDNFRSDLIGMSRKKNVKNDEFAFKNGNPIENFDEMFDYATKVSEQAIDEVDEGFIEAKPVKDECKFCPYLSVCRHSDNDGVRIMQKILDEDLKRKN